MPLFNRAADDGSFKSFEPVPAGRTTLLITKAEAVPQVNPHILSLEMEDAQGRSMKAKFDQNKKTAKGAYAQRFFMNKLIDAVLGEDTSGFDPSRDLEKKFIDAEVTHAQVHKKDKETGEELFEADGSPIYMTFANLGTVYGLGEPFAKKANAADGSDLDAALGL